MKNYKFYIILFLSLFFFIEILSLFLVNIKKKDIERFLSNTRTYSPKIIYQYSEYIPHTRDKITFDKLIDHSELNKSHIDLNKNIYFFSVIEDFKKENTENILVQGDSWAEVFNNRKNFFQIKNYSKVNNVGFINAGITSFSPSAMTSQLNILEKEFKIKPSIIIAIIDQTDIGDELFRYERTSKNLFTKTLSNSIKIFQLNTVDNFNRLNFSSFKLVEYLYDYYLYNKNILKYNDLEIINILYKQTKAKFFKISKILYPLKYGINSKEKEIIKKRISNYIEFALKNKNLKKIYFVSHPHFKHLNQNGYKINISSIIDEAINESDLKDYIYHINFSEIKDSKNYKIYNKTDPYSHLTNEAYANYYLPTILRMVDF